MVEALLICFCGWICEAIAGRQICPREAENPVYANQTPIGAHCDVEADMMVQADHVLEEDEAYFTGTV